MFPSIDVNRKVGERGERSNILLLREKQDISPQTEQNSMHMKAMSTKYFVNVAQCQVEF